MDLNLNVINSEDRNRPNNGHVKPRDEDKRKDGNNERPGGVKGMKQNGESGKRLSG